MYPQTATGYSGQAVNGVSGGGFAISSPATPITPITPMQDARNTLASSIDQLHQRLNDLEERLGVVCRAGVSPPPRGGEERSDVAPSELRAYLTEKSQGVYAAVNRIESLLIRLEL